MKVSRLAKMCPKWTVHVNIENCVEWMSVTAKRQSSWLSYHLSYCLSFITHSIRSFNAPMEQQLQNVDSRGNTPFYVTYFYLLKRVHLNVQGVSGECGSDSLVLRVTLKRLWFLKLNLVGEQIRRCWSEQECLVSRSTVRVWGGLKSSWGRAVGRHSPVTFLSCFRRQTPLGNQSLFAEIRIGLDWNAAQHSCEDFTKYCCIGGDLLCFTYVWTDK